MQETQLADTAVEVSLIFRPKEEAASPSAFLITRMRMRLMDVLQGVQPVNFQQLVERKASVKVTTLLGFSRAAIATNPWRLLLRNCWHRGFSQLDSLDAHQQPVTARYGHIPIRLTLTPLNSVFVLRVETYDKKLLDELRMEMFQLLQAADDTSPPKPQFIRVPVEATVHLQVNFFTPFSSKIANEFK